jgi:general secretion pathway protein G
MTMQHTQRRLARRVARSGFTLIEVLLVVVIIGILVGVAVPRLGGRVRQSQVAAAKAGIENIGTALRLYELDMGQFPASLSALVQNPGGGGGWKGPYLEKGMPKDPWGHDYIYASPGANNQSSFDLKSLGPDGVDSADDVTNWDTGEK